MTVILVFFLNYCECVILNDETPLIFFNIGFPEGLKEIQRFPFFLIAFPIFFKISIFSIINFIYTFSFQFVSFTGFDRNRYPT